MPQSSQDHPEHYVMSFGDHLDELRRRVLLSLAVPLPISIITFFFSDALIEWLAVPLMRALTKADLPTRLQALGPAETLGTQIKLSLIGAIIVSCPWILWQAWLFVRPGLFAEERRFVHLLIPGSVVLTASGLSLMYFAMLPLMLQVLVGFSQSINVAPADEPLDPRIEAVLASGPVVPLVVAPPPDQQEGDIWLEWPKMKLYVALTNADGLLVPVEVAPPPDGTIAQEFRLSTYINFVLLLFLGIVLAFQMPLVIVLLGWLGLAEASWLRAQRKYALLACGVISAVITPADVVSMIIMLIPLYALYELGILLLVMAPASAVAEGRVLSFRRKKSRRDRAAAADGHAETVRQARKTVARDADDAPGEDQPEQDPDEPSAGNEEST